MGDPRVTAYDRVVADHGVAAEYRGAGVYDDVAADIGMALYAFNGIAVVVELKAQSSQRHALIKLDVVFDGAGLADNDSRAVIYKEVFAYLGAGVDVDAGETVGVFGHHTGDELGAQHVMPVGYAVDAYGLERGVGEHDLGLAPRRGVTLVGGADVGLGQRAYLVEP